MQLERVAIFHFTPPPIPPQAIPGRRIDFNFFLWPFVQLVTGTRSALFTTSRVVTEYYQRVTSATYLVFFRLINPPSFDPTSDLFRESMDQLEDQIPIFQGRVNELDQKFWQNHLISRDVQELKKIHSEIRQTLRGLDYYVSTLEWRHHRFPIQDQLVHLRDSFQNLDDQLDLYCLDNGSKILDRFQTAVNLFMQGRNHLPKDIREQLIQTWKSLYDVLRARAMIHPHTKEAKAIYSEIKNLRDQISILDKKVPDDANQVNSAEPLRLRNIGNSCYLDSLLQALFCMDQVREKFNQPIIRDPNHPDEYLKKLTIQQELLQFIDAQQRNSSGAEALTQMEFILLLHGGPSLNRLREAIFKSGFHSELSMSGLRDQHDSAYVIELLLDCFFEEYKFNWRGYASTPIFPGLEFINGGVDGEDEQVSCLQIPLRAKAEHQKLDVLVRASLGKHVQRDKDPGDQRTFDPKDGIVIEGKEDLAAPILDAAATKVPEYHEWYKITKLPPVLTIQFKRFTPGLRKDSRPVELPADGILDLTRYYDAPSGGPKRARYKLKSMVRHMGSSLQSGHYVADVEIGGKYFNCNDLDSKGFKPSTEKDFFSHKDPYLLFFERIDEDEEAAPPPQE